MEGVRWWVVLGVLVGVGGEKWRWPDERSATLKIDTKVRLIDEYRSSKRNEIDSVQNDDVNFKEPLDTTGFYNRPPNDGRYPVKVESPLFDGGIKFRKIDLISQPGHVDLHRHNAESNMDYVRYCKCLDTAECRKNSYDIVRSCDGGKTLCCYLQPNRQLGQSSEFFNEAEDERPDILLPGRSHPGGPFPPPPLYDSTTNPHQTPLIVSPGLSHGAIGSSANIDRRNQPVLVGPGGPTGVVGPTDSSPEYVRNRNGAVLVGPSGPSGIVGPTHIHHAGSHSLPDIHHGHVEHHEPHESAQRGVLVGPGGPTGILGPPGYRRQPLLVGPGGPTGLIGPPNYQNRQPSRFNNYQTRGILTGPQGPTGIIGPGQQILVGPGGPTGRIGPTRSTYFK